jgi:hypothetical protein
MYVNARARTILEVSSNPSVLPLLRANLKGTVTDLLGKDKSKSAGRSAPVCLVPRAAWALLDQVHSLVRRLGVLGSNKPPH